MYTLARVAMSDIEQVLDPDVISSVSKDELVHLGFDRWGAMKGLRDLRNQGDAYSVFEGDDLLAVTGSHVCPLEKDTRATWFVGAQRFFDNPRRSVRYGRHFYRWLSVRYPFRHFMADSYSPHPEAARWLTLIGFRPHGRYPKHQVFRWEAPLAAAKSG